MSERIPVQCSFCLYWKPPRADENWSECMLTAPEAHETLSKVIVYEAIEDEGNSYWESREELEDLIGIMHTRNDYGCVQFEEKSQDIRETP